MKGTTSTASKEYCENDEFSLEYHVTMLKPQSHTFIEFEHFDQVLPCTVHACHLILSYFKVITSSPCMCADLRKPANQTANPPVCSVLPWYPMR